MRGQVRGRDQSGKSNRALRSARGYGIVLGIVPRFKEPYHVSRGFDWVRNMTYSRINACHSPHHQDIHCIFASHYQHRVLRRTFLARRLYVSSFPSISAPSAHGVPTETLWTLLPFDVLPCTIWLSGMRFGWGNELALSIASGRAWRPRPRELSLRAGMFFIHSARCCKDFPRHRRLAWRPRSRDSVPSVER